VKEKTFKRLFKEAFTEFLTSQEGEELIGTIMLKAISQGLYYEVDVVNNREAARKGEEAVKETKKMSILELMAIYLPRIEGALRGMQEDLNKTKYTVDEQHKVSLTFVDLIQHSFKMGVLQPLIDARGKDRIETPNDNGGIKYLRSERSGE
jgi:uncharacterized protein YjgD (DUF1641 family)